MGIFQNHNNIQNSINNRTTQIGFANNAPINKSTKIKIENVLFEYVHLAEPHAFSQNEPLKYSVTLLIPKHNNYAGILQKVRNAISETYNIACQNIWENITQLPNLQTLESKILRDGDTTNNQTYHGYYYIKATRDTKRLVTAIDNNNQAIKNEQQTLQYLSQIQNGDWGIAYLAIKGYGNDNYQGISIFLDAIRKTHNKAANYSSTAINPYSFNPSDYL